MKLKSILIAACAGMLIGSAPVLSAKSLFRENVLASYYGENLHGQPTSSGELFDSREMTAAHRTLPFGTMLEVTNLANGNSVIVRVNDRGPSVNDRELDVSLAAAERLGMTATGVARVSVYILDESEISELAGEPSAVPLAQGESARGLPPSQRPAQPAPPSLFAPTAPVYELPSSPAQSQQPGSMPSFAQGAPVYEFPSSPAQPPAPPAQQPAPPAPPAPAQQPAPPPPAPAQQPAPPAPPAPAESEQTESETAQQPAEGESDPDSPVWRIQLGAFAREENAIRLVREIRAIGLEPAYERNGRLIRVVIPSIADSDLESITSRLLDAGLYDYIIRRER